MQIGDADKKCYKTVSCCMLRSSWQNITAVFSI